jgi:hypothetical protein
MAKRNDLKALRQLIGEAHDLLRTTNLPEQRSQHAYDLLTAAVHLTDTLMEESPAATLGAKGGKVTAKRGPEYFAKIAGMRKERKGGRPKVTTKAK